LKQANICYLTPLPTTIKTIYVKIFQKRRVHQLVRYRVDVSCLKAGYKTAVCICFGAYS